MLHSLEMLNRLRTLGIPSVVIGGWAVYLLTRYHMSRDVDLIMEQKDLWKLRSLVISEGGTEKAPGLAKYGYRLGQVDLDVYTEEKGDLVPSPAEILGRRRFIEIEGLRVVEPEILLILKLRAAAERSGGLKGFKDRCDVLALTRSEMVDLDGFAAECRRLEQVELIKRLLRMVEMAGDELDYVLGKPQTQRGRWRLKWGMVRAVRELMT
jgi:hypothetical protein